LEALDLDATAQAELIRRGEIAPIELVDAAIARIERLNPALNAVITPLFDKARAQAQDDALPQGAFRGVPMLLKDFLCETEGDPYYCGTKFLRDMDWRSKQDSFLAQRLRQAGFILLGKTNLPELAGGAVTESEAFGITRNPWNTDYSPDGSSGGSAAAVASGMVAVAHANDGLGSIRGPASACGLVGLKPSRGRMPVGPGWHAGLFGNISEFVLTRTVRDMANILDAVQGAAPGNVFGAPPPARLYREELSQRPSKLKIGLMAHDTVMNLDVHPDCKRAVEMTGKLLEAAGHTVEFAFPPQLEGATGLGLALRIITATGLAHTLDQWGELIGRPLLEGDVEAGTWQFAEEGRTYSGVQMQAAYTRLANGACRVVEWWQSGYDLLITPVRTQPPPRIATHTQEEIRAAMGFFTMPYNLSGQPALAIPCYVNEAGLPIGVQLVADYGREDVLIQIAALIEDMQPWIDRYPMPDATRRH
jgi:amidase